MYPDLEKSSSSEEYKPELLKMGRRSTTVKEIVAKLNK